MLGFKSFHAAKNILAGIELMYMISKGQLMFGSTGDMSFADQFYALAGQIHSTWERIQNLPVDDKLTRASKKGAAGAGLGQFVE